MDIPNEFSRDKASLERKIEDAILLPVTTLEYGSYNRSSNFGIILISLGKQVFKLPFSHSGQGFEIMPNDIEPPLKSKWIELFVEYREQLQQGIASYLKQSTKDDVVLSASTYRRVYIDTSAGQKFGFECAFNGTDWEFKPF